MLLGLKGDLYLKGTNKNRIIDSSTQRKDKSRQFTKLTRKTSHDNSQN